MSSTEALRAGDARRLGPALSNDLQAPALTLFPALRETLATGRALGALGALVSGSGPTCFFLARDAEHAGRPRGPAVGGGGLPRRSRPPPARSAGASVIERKA